MITDIFYVSYLPDIEWLKYSLRSVAKFVRGYREVVVAVPESELPEFLPLSALCPRVRFSGFKPGIDGHLDQNIQKTCADKHTDAAYILHVDSDVMFVEGTNVQYDFSHNGLPELWYERYDRMVGVWEDHPGGVPWREITEHALGLDVDVETMRRFPILYPRFLYKETRHHIEVTHSVPFEKYVESAPKLGRAFHGFSEFNALGAVAYYLFPDSFFPVSWIDSYDWPKKAKQFWSHHIRLDPHRFEHEIRPELEKIVYLPP